MGMGLDELRRIIVKSDRVDWNVISCLGMPSFLPWSPDGEFEEHHTRATYRPDVSLGLAWGIKVNEKFESEWTDTVANPAHNFSFLADVLYNGMLVSREPLVCVDSGHCYLPLPQEGMRVRRWDHDFAKLLNDLQLVSGVGGGLGDPSRSDFDDYFRGVGLVLDD